jgi:sortase A
MSRRRAGRALVARVVVLTIAMAMVVAACGTSAHDAATRRSASRRAGGPVATTTTTPPVSSSTTVADDPIPRAKPSVKLPVPARAPNDPYAAVPVTKIGTIVIPRIGVRHPIYEGIWLTVIDHGPGHWPGTALPGRLGNTVFPGHRVTHTHPFLDLDGLRPGDTIIFEMAYGTFTYKVRDTIIVAPTDTWVVEQRADHEVTLIACNPKHSARQRIVVRGVLVTSAAPTPGSVT